eukprot:scaffold21720_cov126-Isochrysis_galbana.AAC.3
MMDAQESKRHRANMVPGASGSQPQVAWPSAVDLYAEGLSRRVEAETRNSSWAVDARQLRASAFSAADADGSGLRQRQLSMRKQLLRKPTAE